MKEVLKDCMDCENIKTEKKYDRNANSYRINVCDITNKELEWDRDLKLINEANGCENYKHY